MQLTERSITSLLDSPSISIYLLFIPFSYTRLLVNATAEMALLVSGSPGTREAVNRLGGWLDTFFVFFMINWRDRRPDPRAQKPTLLRSGTTRRRSDLPLLEGVSQPL